MFTLFYHARLPFVLTLSALWALGCTEQTSPPEGGAALQPQAEAPADPAKKPELLVRLPEG